MTIGTEELIYILDNTPATQNIMLMGKHGIGKSQILENYFNKKGCKVVTLFLGQMSDPGDLIGLPEKNEKTGKTDFMLPYWFPTDNTPIVLFLDELNRARPEVLQTIMDLTLNRKLAGKSLPEGSRIISAVNNGNEYQLTDLDPALVSRFNIYEFEPSVAEWISWGEKSGIDSRILSFISEYPEYLDSSNIEGDGNDLERTPDRRSWHRTSEVIKNFSELTNLQKPIVSGIIGNRATTTFFRFVNERKLPTTQEILCGDFTQVIDKLSKVSIPDFTLLNNSVFRFIESGNYDKEKSDLIAKNIKNYFDYICENVSKEITAHFVSLISAENYPETLCFITEKSPELYKKLLSEVSAL